MEPRTDRRTLPPGAPPAHQPRDDHRHVWADKRAGGTLHTYLRGHPNKTGYLALGKLPARTMAAVNHRATRLLRQQPRPVHTLTCDKGTEFHGYTKLEAATNVRCYFATPPHAWERGTNENTNGLVRQYLPQRMSLAHLTQRECTAIARALNQRPRKRLGYRTPEECYAS